MAGLWRIKLYWRQNWDRNQPYPDLVHLHFASYNGITHYYLYDPCLSDECKTIYQSKEKKPYLVFVVKNG